mmetsp:Transcript_5151/g.19307  ORF Transcript_5151/g.19307 Transcript_5151/m.19307 type:complete len:119 (+) Transcript_5151:1534-1890(+)
MHPIFLPKDPVSSCALLFFLTPTMLCVQNSFCLTHKAFFHSFQGYNLLLHGRPQKRGFLSKPPHMQHAGAHSGGGGGGGGLTHQKYTYSKKESLHIMTDSVERICLIPGAHIDTHRNL